MGSSSIDPIWFRQFLMKCFCFSLEVFTAVEIAGAGAYSEAPAENESATV